MKWKGVERSCDNCVDCDPCSWKAVPGRSMYGKCVEPGYIKWSPDIYTREEYYIGLLKRAYELLIESEWVDSGCDCCGTDLVIHEDVYALKEEIRECLGLEEEE